MACTLFLPGKPAEAEHSAADAELLILRLEAGSYPAALLDAFPHPFFLGLGFWIQ